MCLENKSGYLEQFSRYMYLEQLTWIILNELVRTKIGWLLPAQFIIGEGKLLHVVAVNGNPICKWWVGWLKRFLELDNGVWWVRDHWRTKQFFMLYRKDIKLEAYDRPFIDSFSAEISEKGRTQC